MSERLILSIDGGGIRGIIPARVLQHIESLAGCSIAAGFDLMVGTSTGGLLALGLATSSNRLTSRIDELVALYLERGARIFDANSGAGCARPMACLMSGIRTSPWSQSYESSLVIGC